MLVEKIASENGGLSISEAVIFCAQHDYKITRQGLSQIGKKYNFVSIIDGHDIVNKAGLFQHIRIIQEPPPEGWVLLASMRYLEKNYSTFYYKIKRSGIELRLYGKERKRYGKESEIKAIFK